MTTNIIDGYRFASVHCGIKSRSTQEDLTLIVSDRSATAVGVFTKNRFQAASVIVNKERTPSVVVRAVVANSGNANACTGQQGIEDARHVTRLVADGIQVRPEQVLCLSTGIIGVHLPVPKISDGITRAISRLASDDDAFSSAARGILTTDTRTKTATRTFALTDRTYTIAGMAKGAAMIGPHMATMLAIILTDAALSPLDAQRMLSGAVDHSFHQISVDGHMSTNDTVLLLANGDPRQSMSDPDRDIFSAALRDVCVTLAKSIPGDGEGATHLIEISVRGARNRDDAHRIAKAVADSPLVKTAIAGADPNWGRIVSAVGYSGADFDPAQVELRLNGQLLFRDLTPVEFDPESVSQSIRAQRDTRIELDVGTGDSTVTFWTCDLTAEYVRLNADYHT
jgi:glutamate N-acetyltransferase/amino-acid N-acetyltransferase